MLKPILIGVCVVCARTGNAELKSAEPIKAVDSRRVIPLIVFPPSVYDLSSVSAEPFAKAIRSCWWSRWLNGRLVCSLRQPTEHSLCHANAASNSSLAFSNGTERFALDLSQRFSA
jgi:hypothetical protein